MDTKTPQRRIPTESCLRCGIRVWAGCCRDCRSVDPHLCDELVQATRKRAVA